MSSESIQTDPLSRRTSYVYDAAGQETTQADARGVRVTYAYDLKGQLTSKHFTHDPTVTFSYDSVGNRLTMADGTGITTSTYDLLDRTSSVTNPRGKAVNYRYDAVGQRIGMTEPEGGRFTYAYDGAGRTKSVKVPFNVTTTFVYDAAGQNITRTDLGILQKLFTQTYDPAGRLTRIYRGEASNTGIAVIVSTYTYDGTSQRMSVIELNGDQTAWKYDRAYQVTNETRTGANAYNTTHTYDPVGNRLVKKDSGALTTFSYDTANQLVTSVDVSGTTNYAFDSAGNQRKTTDPVGGITTSTWDDENHRTRVQLPSGVINTFTYDGDGLRQIKLDSTGTTKFVWDGQNYLSEYNAANSRTVIYGQTADQYGLLLNRKIVTFAQPEIYYPDALGSLMMGSINSTGNITARYLIKAFGETTTLVGTHSSPFRWVGLYGYYYDEDLLDYYLRARAYRPTLARFLSEDSLRFDGGDWNLFQYVLNNPLNAGDPSGLIVFTPPVALGKCPPSKEGKLSTIVNPTPQTIGPRKELAELDCTVRIPRCSPYVTMPRPAYDEVPGTKTCTRTATYVFPRYTRWHIHCLHGVSYLSTTEEPKGKSVTISATPWRCEKCIPTYPKPWYVTGPPNNIA